MTGERWEWFRVASHLKTPVDELKARITFAEFLDWCTFLNKEQIETQVKQEYGLALIAAEIRRTIAKHPSQVNVKDFLIRFVTEADRSRMNESKAAWMGCVGLNPDGTRKEVKNN